jgi:hypothetical protein
MDPNGRIIRTYAEFTDAIHARIIELRIPHLDVDRVAGLATGHTGKLVGPRPRKFYGPISFDNHLAALGLMLVMQPDPDRPPRITNTRKLNIANTEAASVSRRLTRQAHEAITEMLRRNGRIGGRKSAAGRMKKLSARERSRIGRRNIKTRWNKRRTRK